MNILFPKGHKSRGIKLFLAYTIHDSKLKQVMRKRGVIQSNSAFHAEVSNKRAE